MRILAIIIHITGVTQLITLSIAELDNKDANHTTKYMKISNHLLTDIKFLVNFNNTFLSTQSYDLVNL